MRSRSSDGRDWQHPALTATLRLLKARRGKPSEADRPPVKPFPGRKPKVLPGQLDFDGYEAGER